MQCDHWSTVVGPKTCMSSRRALVIAPEWNGPFEESLKNIALSAYRLTNFGNHIKFETLGRKPNKMFESSQSSAPLGDVSDPTLYPKLIVFCHAHRLRVHFANHCRRVAYGQLMPVKCLATFLFPLINFVFRLRLSRTLSSRPQAKSCRKWGPHVSTHPPL